jgi:hypothetical protein
LDSKLSLGSENLLKIMELTIIPFESVGPVTFGASPETVRASTNSPWTTFLKNLEAPDMPTDAFDEAGFHVYYASGKCEAVECFSPASLIFQGKELIGQPYKEVKEWLASIDSKIVYDGESGLQARSFGIGIYAPNAVVEGVIVVDKEYFDKQDEILRAAGLL